MRKPRWKIVTELAVAIVWIGLMGVVWESHEHDQTPFNVIWLTMAAINTLRALRLLQSSWKQL